MLGYLTIAACLGLFCMVANRLESTVITAPMVFLGLGALVASLGVMPAEGSEATLHIVAETALVVLLFLDAAKIDQAALLKRRVWPARMLGIGLPLAFALGAVAAWVVLPGWPLAAVALAAAILTPTDAALGQPVVSNRDIPERPRRALTVESGLNDGLALPLVLLMAALAAPAFMAPDGGWLLFVLKQLSFGPVVGLGVGILGGIILLWAKRTNATSDVYEGIGALALAATAYLGAELVGGNGFISAFAAGLGFGGIVRGQCAFVFEFTEGEGQLLSWSAFLLIGAVLVPEAVAHLTANVFLLILLSLFVIRPLAIWISLMGTDASPSTRLFFGWFGPRGLATALFALLVLDHLGPDIGDDILHLAINTVWISALLHGLTAAPGARLYARRLEKMEDAAEQAPMRGSTPAFRDRLIKTGGTSE
ncbi:cation:proton antiporter [Tropicimonas sp. S265A]|uniref:cation:proton antiporter domain-containing protein n=1 Tax=Tropicimonas sp. S265A TaxID=3415134 RepID=UPI003C7AEB51